VAVANYEPIDAGACVDQEFFPLAHRSLKALEQAAKDGGGDVECVHISGSISGDTTTGESCAQLESPTDMPTQYLNSDQVCCLIISVTGGLQNPDNPYGAIILGPRDEFYYPYAGINTFVRCNGKTIGSDEGRGSGIMTVLIDPTTCDFRNGLEFCVDAYTDTAQQLEYNITWCGCLLCIQCPPLPLEDYYIPEIRDPNCDFGLGDFAQVIHTLNQLSAAFRCTGYTVDCVVREDVTFNALVDGPLDNESKWIGIACTRATWQGAPVGSTIRANVSMGCESQTIICNSSSYVSRVDARAASLFNPATTEEAEFVSVACGVCQAGESIYFNSVPEINCTAVADEEEQNDGGVIEVEGISEMVFFIFRKLEAELPEIPQVSSGCIFQDNVDAVLEAGEKIHEAACQIKKPNKQSKVFASTGGQGVHTEIVAASPWPPPTPPPRPVPDPPPIKKWAILGSAQAQVEINDVSIFSSTVTVSAQFNYEVKCGGAPIHTSPWYSWPVVVNWNTFPISYRVPVCAIVDCPIDENIEICMNFQQAGYAVQVRGVSSGIALCIT